MNAGTIASLLAKITRPESDTILIRRRLFRCLDEAMKRPVVWITSLAGSGKTMLVSSYVSERKTPCLWYRCDQEDADLGTFFYYLGLAVQKTKPGRSQPLPLLTPEYLAGIPEFTRRFWGDLFSRVLPARSRKRSAFALVLDNYQEVPAVSLFHSMLAIGLDMLPRGVQMIVMSRTDPPVALSRLRANGAISVLDYADVRFTREESAELARARDPGLDKKSIEAMYEKTQGWAAGLVLMLERTRLRGGAEEFGEEPVSEDIFDYFAGEIFDKTEKEVQDFLTKTAFLPVLNVSLTEQLTGLRNAGRILATLHRNNFFTDRLVGPGQEYHYHPLFREFLLSRAKAESTPDELAEMEISAAAVLEQAGQQEDAAALYCEAQDRDGLARIVRQAAGRLLRQGRNGIVEHWISCIPRGIDDDPWLLYWSGMSSFPIDMRRTRLQLGKALEGFRLDRDAAGVFLAWAGIVDTYALELDEWARLDGCIAEFSALRKTCPSFPSKEIELVASSRMLIALALRRTDRPEQVGRWLGRVTQLLREIPSPDIQLDTIFYMSVYYLWSGEYAANAIMLEQANAEVQRNKPHLFAAIRIKLMKGIHSWVTAEHGTADATLADGLAIADESGVHVFDFLLWNFRAAAAMASGDAGKVKEALSRMQALLPGAKTLDVYFFHISSAWHALLEGEVSAAAEHAGAIARTAATMDNPYYRGLWQIGMAHIAFRQGRGREALLHGRGAHRTSLDVKSRVLEWSSLLSLAYFHLKDGDERRGLAALRRGLAIGRAHGYVLLEFHQPDVLSFLLATALSHGIETNYAAAVIRKLELTPPGMVPGWPYPVRITTLGSFEIRRDDRPLAFSGKAPRRALELLQILIAFGGRNVPIGKIADELWPDADGDAAYRSFRVALHGLRSLLGLEDSITSSEGRISLNSNVCFVDLAAFLDLCDRIAGARTDAVGREAKEPLLLAEEAIGLYRGNFLQDGENRSSIAAARERARARFGRLIEATGARYEAMRQWNKAAAMYERGMDMDELREEFYRRLMFCLAKLGRHSEAASVYDRCRRMLRVNFNVEPSLATKAVYEKIIVG